MIEWLFETIGARFLPAGRGGLILMLGGFSMLLWSLFALSWRGNGIPEGARVSGRDLWGHQHSVDASWSRILARDLQRRGLGDLRMIPIGATSCALLLPAAGKDRCKSAQRRIRRSARRIDRHANVQEVHCGRSDHGPCRFAIDMQR